MSDFYTSHRIMPADEIDCTAEAGLVQERAERGQPSVIRLGPIVFFSTANRDAWMIDVLGGEAACLARAGKALPIPIVDSPSRFGIAWQARHQLDGDAFVVIDNDGRAQTYPDYPVAQIRRQIAEYPAEFSGIRVSDAPAARLRLQQTGRNAPCPCGSGRKYKKCCLALDEVAAAPGRRVQRTELQLLEAADADAAVEDRPADFADEDGTLDLASETTPAPAGQATADAGEPEVAPEVRAAADKIRDELDRLGRPTSAQLDAWLDRLLALPPAATSWADVFDALSEKNHADLPAVFRRIAAVLPPTKAAGASFLYWGAMERFVSRGRADLVPEIASGFRRLGREGYDADALKHMVFWAMAAGHDADALALQEHFLSIMRSDDDLMPYAVPSACRSIFELRVGLRLPELGTISVDGAVEELARELRRDVDDEIHVDFARRAARVLRGEAPMGECRREDFDLPRGGLHEDGPAWEKALRQFEAIMHVAHEAWQSGGRPPGGAFRGLWLLVDAVGDERDQRPKRKRSGPENLLDCLQPAGMERRIVLSARDLVGTNVPHAHLLVEAHADLLRFATRCRLVGDADAAKSERTIAALRKKLGFAAGSSC